MIDFSESKLYIPGLNYYKQNAFISNSELGAFLDWYYSRFKPDLTAAYAFGNLIDSIITEPNLVDFSNLTVTLADGGIATFTNEIFKKSQDMKAAAFADPTIKMLLNFMDFQFEKYVDQFEIEYQGFKFRVPIRVKLDGNNKPLKTALDIKSTSCTTIKSFIDSLYHFDYDRQASLYMDITGAERFWFVGIGKIPLRNGRYPVFKFAVKRGDDFYQGGKAKYQAAAYKHYILIHSLNTNLI